MTDEKNAKAPDESGMIKADPAFDPAWDLKVAQKPVNKHAESAEIEKVGIENESEMPAEAKRDMQEQDQVADENREQVEVEGFESSEEVPEFIKEQKTDKQEVAPVAEQGAVKSAEAQDSQGKQVQEGARGFLPPLPKPVASDQHKPAKKHKRIIWGDIISCWVLGIGFLTVLGILLIFLLAKSGIVHVPILSDWLYEAPIPSRYIIGQPMDWERFQELATNRLIEQDMQQEPPIALNMHESEFTGLLHGVVEQGLRSDDYQAEVAQVVFLEDSIEMYFYLTWKDFFSFEILTHLVPIVEDDGTLKFEVTDAKFGDLPIPGDWVIGMIGYFFERDIGVWRIVLSNGYGIQDTDLAPPAINLLIGPVSSE